MKFSLVMPAYNSEKTIAESIDTVIAQTCGDWELIVVNDGSQDSTLDIVKSYVSSDGRIRVFSQENAGTAAANNFGISQAVGDYITIFPSDDWLLPNYLESFKLHIEDKPGFDIYTANGWFKYEDGYENKIIGEGLLSEEPTFIELIKTCPCSLGAMVKQGVHARVGWYRKERYTEDYDFWLRAAHLNLKFYFFDEPLVKVRVSKTQKSANTKAIHESDILIMQDLLADGTNSADVVETLANRIAEIEKLKKMKPGNRAAIGREFEARAQRFSAKVEKIVGSENLPAAMNAIHKVSFIARPFRWVALNIKMFFKKK